MSIFNTLHIKSLKYKIITNVVLLHAILMGFIIFDMLHRQKEFMRDDIESRAKGFAKVLSLNSRSWLITNDLVALNELLEGLASSSDIKDALILDRYLRVKASIDEQHFNRVLSDAKSVMLLEKIKRSDEKTILDWHHGMVDVITKIEVEGRVIGYVRVLIDSQKVEKELAFMTKEGLVYTLMAILIGALFAWLTIRIVIKRLNILTNRADLISSGSFDGSVPVFKGDDEVARLSRAFSVMMKNIALKTTALTKARDEALIADRLKSEFIANISHEIRTPLNAVLGYAELLGGSCIDEKGRGYLKSIEASGKSLLALIEEILELSKAEASVVKIEKSATDLEQLLREIRAIFELKSKQKGVLIEIEMSSETPKIISIDSKRVRQILINLLGNAIKFSRAESSVVIQTAAVPRSDGMIDLDIAVKDEGIGIAKEEQESIFRAFVQSSKNQQGKYEGSGLGLSISKKLAEDIGGELLLESVEGEGATFTLRLQGVEVESESQQSASEDEGSQKVIEREFTISAAVRSKLKHRYRAEYDTIAKLRINDEIEEFVTKIAKDSELNSDKDLVALCELCHKAAQELKIVEMHSYFHILGQMIE